MYKFSYDNQKLFDLRYSSELSGYHWLQVSKGQAILLQWRYFTSPGDGSTSSADGSTIWTSIKYNEMI